MRKRSKRQIEKIAISFRKAIEEAHNHSEFQKYPFNKFPNDCCDDTSVLLGQFFLEKGYPCQIVRGDYYIDYYEDNQKYQRHCYHVWLKVNEFYADLTADQFIKEEYFSKVKDLIDTCYVGTSNKFFESFESLEINDYYGIDDYAHTSNERFRLKSLYSIICHYL